MNVQNKVKHLMKLRELLGVIHENLTNDDTDDQHEEIGDLHDRICICLDYHWGFLGLDGDSYEQAYPMWLKKNDLTDTGKDEALTMMGKLGVKSRDLVRPTGATTNRSNDDDDDDWNE